MQDNPEAKNEKPEDSKDPLKESQDAEDEAKKLEDPKKKENVEGGEAGKANLGKVEGDVKNVGNLKEVEYKVVNGRTIEVDVSEKNAAEATREAHQEERLDAARAKAELAKEMKLQPETPEAEEPKNPELAKVEDEQKGEEEKAKGEEEKDMTGVQENADTWLKESNIEAQDAGGVGTNVG